MRRDDSRTEDALGALAPLGPDLADGLTSHAPMVADALAALGRADAVLPWIERRRAGFLPRPRPAARIPPAEWRAALGRTERVGDWSALLETSSSASVRGGRSPVSGRSGSPRASAPRRCTARSAPPTPSGASRPPSPPPASASSATRSRTGRRGTNGCRPPRRAAPRSRRTARSARCRSCRPSSGSSTARSSARSPRSPPSPTSRRPRPASSCPPSRPADVLSAASECFARVLLANARDRLSAVVFTHAVTGPAALRPLLPHVTPAGRAALVRAASRSGCALLATFGAAARPSPKASGRRARAPRSSSTGRSAAGTSTRSSSAACLHEHERRPSAAYLAASRRGAELLGEEA